MLSLKVAQEFFRDKRVVIVGNSVEMLNHDKGEFIDSFDKVIRLGKGIYTAGREVSLGSKQSVWATGDWRLKERWVAGSEEWWPEVRLVLFNRGRMRLMEKGRPAVFDHLHKIPPNKITNMFTDDELRENHLRFGLTGWHKDWEKRTARLSNGMTTIMYMVEKVKTYKSLDLIGFDFFKKHTDHTGFSGDYDPAHSWHKPTRHELWSNSKFEHDHDHKIEKAYVKQAEADGKLKWNILTNLEDENIAEPKYCSYKNYV